MDATFENRHSTRSERRIRRRFAKQQLLREAEENYQRCSHEWAVAREAEQKLFGVMIDAKKLLMKLRD